MRYIFSFFQLMTIFLATEQLYAQDDKKSESSFENYEEIYHKEGLEIETFFNEELKRIEDSYVIAKFVKKYQNSKNLQVTCLQLAEFFVALDSVERRKLIEEYKYIRNIPTAEFVPFEFKNNSKLQAKFYEKGTSRLVNFLEVIEFALANNLDYKNIFNQREQLFINHGLDIKFLSFAQWNEPINVKQLQRFLYERVLRDVRVEVEEKLIEASKGFDLVKQSLFLPEEVFENPKKILYVLNTCGWSQNKVVLKDTGLSTTYENYALMHMQEITKFLDKESQVMVGYINHKDYAYNENFLLPENFYAFINPFSTFSELQNSLSSNPNSHKGSTNLEAISGLYNNTRKKGFSYDYILFFTDGYATSYLSERSSVASNPKAVFLFKAMAPEKGTFKKYIAKVPRPKDIVLNQEYYAPHYREYFDRKAAREVLSALLVRIDEMLK